MITVSLLGQDISQYVQAMPSLPVANGQFGQVTVASLPQLVGLNSTGFWDPQNAASPFYLVSDLSLYRIDIYSDGALVTSATIQSLTVDYATKLAAIELRGVLQAALERGCEYESTPQANPATIVQEIAELYGIAIDPSSFAVALDAYTQDLTVLNAGYLSPDVSVLDAIEQVCALVCARVYALNDILYMDAYAPSTATPLVTFSDSAYGYSAIWSPGGPQIAVLTKEIASGYLVEWAGTPTADSGGTTASRKTISGTNDMPASIATFEAAVAIGERWHTYLNTPQRLVTFGVAPAYGTQLGLGYPIAIAYNRWTEAVTIDISSIDTSNGAVTMITGVTR